MPTPKRWHPVSRDLNEDVELWSFTDRFGDRYLRLWLEILAGLDRYDNHWQVHGDWIGSLARKCHLNNPRTVGKCALAVAWLVDNQWITVVQSPSRDALEPLQTASRQALEPLQTASRQALETIQSGSRLVLSSRNYLKFHKMKELKGAIKVPFQVPSYPNLSYPNLRDKNLIPVEEGDNSRSGGESLTRLSTGFTSLFRKKTQPLDDGQTLESLREEPSL